MKQVKLILSIILLLTATIANGQIQEYVIEASDSLITRGVLQIDADKFKATTQVSSDDTTLVSLDYLTNLLDNAEYADSLAFHSNTGYLVYYRQGVALDSTSMDGRYQTILTNPITGTGTTNYIPKWTGLSTLGNSSIYDNGSSVGINTTNIGLIGATNFSNVISHIKHPTSFTRQLIDGTTFAQLLFHTSSDAANQNIKYIGSNGGKLYLGKFDDVGNVTNQLVITDPGNVGIGTTAPAQKLDVDGNIRVRGVGTNTTSTVLGLDSNGNLTTNVTITGGATWKGGWNASTNTPTLSDATGTNGWWYKVTTAGTQNLGSGSITFAVGDDIIHNGTIWQKYSAMISEADPVFVASDVYEWTEQDSIEWSTAYSWGDHSIEGYLTSEVDGSVTNELQNLSLGTTTTTTQPVNISSGTGVTLPAATTSTAGLMSSTDKTNLNTVVGYGNHSGNYIAIGPSTTNTGKAPYTGDTGDLRNTVAWATGLNRPLNTSSAIASFTPISTGTYGFQLGSRTQNLSYRGFENNVWGDWVQVYHTGNFTDNSTNWNTAYNDKINSAAFSGTTTKTLTLTQQDGGTVTANFTDNNTTYSAGTGLSLAGTTFNHSNSVTAGTASEGGVTRTLAFGGTFNIPSVTYDAQGHITGKGTTTLTMPANPNTDSQNLSLGTVTATTQPINISSGTGVTLPAATTSAAGLMSATDKTNLNAAYNDRIASAAFSGTTTKTLTLTQQDGGTVTANFTDDNTTYTGSAGVQLVGNDFRMNIGSLNVGAISASTHYIPWYQTTGAHWRTTLAELQAVAGYNAGKIQNVTVSSTAPTTDYVLKYNGTTWAPAPDATGAGALTSGDAISVVGDSINYKPTRITATMTDLNMLNNAASIVTNFEYGGALYRTTLGQLSDLGLYNARELRGYTIASATPSTGEVLKWTGSQWEPEPDATGGMTDPMTTRGDIIYRNSSNVTARLGRGTAGQLLYSNGTDLSWRTPVKADVGLGNVENTALSTWTGSTNLSTVGSITQGNWNADPISVTKGGTGKTSYTAYALLAGGSTSTGTLQQVSGVGTSGQVLTSNGASALPSWQDNPVSQWTTTGTLIHPTDTFVYDVAIGTKTRYSTNRLTVEGSIYASSYGKFVDGISTNGGLEATYSVIDRYMIVKPYDDILTTAITSPLLSTLNDQHRLVYKTGSSIGQIYTYSLTPHYQTTTSTGAITFDYKYGDMVNDTLTSNNTYNMTYIPDGASGEILVRQDGTGGRTLTLNMYPLSTSSTALTKVTVGATTGIKTTANNHTLIRYRRWGTKVTLEYLQEP